MYRADRHESTSVTGSSNVDHEAIDNDATQRKATKSVSTAEDERVSLTITIYIPCLDYSSKRPYRRIYDCKFVKKPGKYYWFKSTSLSHLASPPPFPEGYVQKVDLVYYNHVLSATEAHQFWWRAQHDPEWTPMVFGDTKVFYDETYYLSCTPSGAVSWVNLQTFKGKLRGMKKKIGE